MTSIFQALPQKEMPREHRQYFGQAPPKIIDGRPESDCKFLMWLRGKEHIMHPLASRDTVDRDLVGGTTEAIAILGDLRGRMRRSIAGEVLHRTLFLYYWVRAHRNIAQDSSFDDLSKRATEVLLDTGLGTSIGDGNGDNVIGRLGTSLNEMTAKRWNPKSWIELAVLLVYDDARTAQRELVHGMELHTKLSTRGAAHLALVMQNVHRTHWVAAAVLDSDHLKAQAAASALLHILDTTAPQRQSQFEKSLSTNDMYMQNLHDMATCTPALCLWKGHGRFGPLFNFLSLRFLRGPDQVLDCEAIHARWQWLCAAKKSLKLKMLNAHLRILCFLEQHGMELPPDEELEPLLQAEMAHQRAQEQRIHQADVIAPGWRADSMFLARFNLAAADGHLLEEDVLPEPGMVHTRTEYRTHWSNYLRRTFAPQRFLCSRLWRPRPTSTLWRRKPSLAVSHGTLTIARVVRWCVASSSPSQARPPMMGNMFDAWTANQPHPGTPPPNTRIAKHLKD